MLRTVFFAAPLVLITVVSCGDSSSSDDSSPSGGGDSNSNGGEMSQAGSNETSTAGNTSSGGTTSSSAGAPAQPEGGAAPQTMGGAPTGNGNGGATVDLGGANANAAGGAAQCPDVFGTYTIKNREGTCGTLNKAAPQSIEGDDTTCVATFVSNPAKGAKGVNGAVALDENGNFTKAKLLLDATASSPCEGTWNAQAQIMTVKCGAPGDLCTILLQKQ